MTSDDQRFRSPLILLPNRLPTGPFDGLALMAASYKEAGEIVKLDQHLQAWICVAFFVFSKIRTFWGHQEGVFIILDSVVLQPCMVYCMILYVYTYMHM